MTSFWQNALLQKDANGKYVVVGMEHWAYYDQANEGWNAGLATSYGDNPYDGSAEINGSLGSCATSHSYLAPAICKDANNNYEAISANCTSGGSAPTWATQNGTVTIDGTCNWHNEGPITLRPEANSVPPSATFPNVGYGDVITPISDFLNAGICDP